MLRPLMYSQEGEKKKKKTQQPSECVQGYLKRFPPHTCWTGLKSNGG